MIKFVGKVIRKNFLDGDFSCIEVESCFFIGFGLVSLSQSIIEIEENIFQK